MSYISQKTHKNAFKKKRLCVCQLARLDGVLNTARHCDTHTQVSGPYNCLKKIQNKTSVGAKSAEWSGVASACLYRNRALRHRDQSLVAFLLKWKSSEIRAQSTRGSQWAPPIILSSASFQTATVSCWMGTNVLHSVTVLQQMFSGCVRAWKPS